MRGIKTGPSMQGVFMRKQGADGRMRNYRTCAKCHKTLPLARFSIMKNGSKPRRYAYCIPCHREYEKMRKGSYAAMRARNDPVFYRKRREARWRISGMRSSLDPEAWFTEDEFNLLLRNQRGACAACGRKFGPHLRPNVDHRHKHGKIGQVRGLLCWHDNRRLADNSQSVLLYLLEYLIRTEGREIT